jgi:hypothetical protein
MIPPSIISRIWSGLVVYTKLLASLPNHNAELYIGPVIDRDKGHLKQQAADIPILVRYQSTVDPVIGYHVLYRELDRDLLHDPNNWEGFEPTINQTFEVASEEELTRLLTRWLDDFTVLHAPDPPHPHADRQVPPY